MVRQILDTTSGATRRGEIPERGYVRLAVGELERLFAPTDGASCKGMPQRNNRSVGDTRAREARRSRL